MKSKPKRSAAKAGGGTQAPPDAQDKGTTPAEAPEISKEQLKAVLSQLQVITPEEVAEYEKKAEEWAGSHDAFLDWTLTRMYVYLQILNRIATNPPPGRSAGMLVITAIKDVREQCATLVDLIIENRNTKGGKKTR